MSGTWQSLKTNKTCGLFSIVAFAYMAPQGISLSGGAGLRSGLLVASRQEGLEMVWYNQTVGGPPSYSSVELHTQTISIP